MAKKALTEEERKNLGCIASELSEIRKCIEEIAEALVNLNDKEFLRSFDADHETLKESQVEKYKEKLEKQVDRAKRELKS